MLYLLFVVVFLSSAGIMDSAWAAQGILNAWLLPTTHPSFMSGKPNAILDGCRSNFVIKPGSWRLYTLRKFQRWHSPLQSVCLCSFLSGFHKNLQWPTSACFLHQTFNLGYKNKPVQAFACLNIMYFFLLVEIIYGFYAKLSGMQFVILLSLKKLIILRWSTPPTHSIPLPILDYNLNMYFWHALI